MVRWQVLDHQARPYACAVALIALAAICQAIGYSHAEHLRSLIVLSFPLMALAVIGLLYAAKAQSRSVHAATAAEQLRLAQDGTGLGVYQLDFKQNTAFASPSLCRLLGQPVMAQPIPLDQWFAALHPAHVANAMRTIEQRIALGQLRYSVDQQIETADGSIRWLETQVQLYLDPAGALAAAHGATIDITERKLLLQTQDELRQTVADMRRLHALGTELAAARDDLSGPMDSLLQVILEFHGAAQGLLTLRREGGKDFAIVAQRGLGADHTAAAGATIEVRATAGESVLAAHARYGREAGFPAVLCTPMLAADGRPTGVIAVLPPQARASTAREAELSELCAAMAGAVVERESARARADEEGSRFAVALDSSTVPFNILAPVRDAEGRLIDLRWTYVNAAAARLEGREPRELLNRVVTDIRPRNWETPGLLARFATLLDEGGVCEFETQSLYKPELWMHVIAAPLLGSVAVWYSDVSERKRQERERAEADRLKDEFLATLAHELRNPLAPILQSIRIARVANASKDQVRWAHAVIERQVQHMALLLDDLLDVSRITRGNLLLRKAPVCVSEIIEAAMEVARPLLETQGHRCSVQLPEDRVWVDADFLRMAQVVANLLTNAAKYTDPGGEISVRVATEGDAVLIRVTDSGIGFTAEQARTLFDMFSQVPVALSRSKGGLGIGLALARSLVRLHGGEIEAYSRGPGQGSEFTVRFPRGDVAAPVPAASACPAVAGSDRPRRLLIADDNADAADTMANLLQLEGYEVHVAYDGDQAVQQFVVHEPAVALLDVGMPKRSGYDVARAIRSLPGGRGAVLIAITGWGQTHDRDAAFEAGFDHHSTKPVDPVKIIALIDSAGANVRS